MASNNQEQGASVTIITTKKKFGDDCTKCDPNSTYRQKYTEEQFASLPLIINYIENGNKKVVDVRPEMANTYSSNEIMPYFEEAFQLERNCNGDLRRLSPSNEVLDLLSKHLELFVEKGTELSPPHLKAVFRYFRNIAANSNSQLYIVHNTVVLETIKCLGELVLNEENVQINLKVPFQLLINLITANEDVVRPIYYRCAGIVKGCMSKDYHVYECSAFFYNASLHMDFSDCDLFARFVRHYGTDNDNEFIHFFLENAMTRNDFWPTYQSFAKPEKVKVLEFLREKSLKNKDIKLDLTCLKVISEDFVRFSKFIFRLDVTNEVERVRYITLMLQNLSTLSGNEQYLPELKRNKDLFTHIGVILINVHRWGKLPGNPFTPIQKLSENFNEELMGHPVMGFKADIIRYLGNLCWKNPEYQNLARTAEFIPLILDCCNMDGKNPFIMQWCILAIRNICEGNIENQKLIASLQKVGHVSSATLEEMGIILQSDGENNLKIVPLDQSKLQ